MRVRVVPVLSRMLRPGTILGEEAKAVRR